MNPVVTWPWAGQAGTPAAAAFHTASSVWRAPRCSSARRRGYVMAEAAEGHWWAGATAGDAGEACTMAGEQSWHWCMSDWSGPSPGRRTSVTSPAAAGSRCSWLHNTDRDQSAPIVTNNISQISLDSECDSRPLQTTGELITKSCWSWYHQDVVSLFTSRYVLLEMAIKWSTKKLSINSLKKNYVA